jgi:hypothetical protein
MGGATFMFTPAAPGFYAGFRADGRRHFSANYREYYFMVNSAP